MLFKSQMVLFNLNYRVVIAIYYQQAVEADIMRKLYSMYVVFVASLSYFGQ